MIVCHCARVTDRDIRNAIDDGASTLSAVVKATGAGRCCEPCRVEIRGLLGSSAAGDHHADAPAAGGL